MEPQMNADERRKFEQCKHGTPSGPRRSGPYCNARRGRPSMGFDMAYRHIYCIGCHKFEARAVTVN